LRFRRWLRQRRFVQLALSTPPDPLFRQKPSPRIVAGLVLLGASYLLGWPAIAALAAISAWIGRPKLLLGGPVMYGVSWLVFALGLILIGSKSIAAGRALGLTLVRKLAELYLGE
jgi:hypothetical protein